ncbi:ABC transporter substrate-binding protein [soil metagenome]
MQSANPKGITMPLASLLKCKASLTGIALVLSLAFSTAQAETVLKVVPHADLTVLDPLYTTAMITTQHGMMVYDTLFGLDAKLEAQPQMVDKYTMDAAGLKHSFTLRPGLKFHDGSDVTTRDVIASLNRWMKRSPVGIKLAANMTAITAVDAKTFTIELKEPFRQMGLILSTGTTNFPVIMREKEALTDPGKAVTEIVGSGPFKFVKAEWVPGAKVVYVKFKEYVPRKEAPSGLAGGKVVNVDRVEYIVMPDDTTKVQALLTGEVDMIDQLTPEQAAVVEGKPKVKVGTVWTPEPYGIIRPNSLIAPFNNIKARQALALMVDQAEYMTASVGDKKWWRKCYSYFVCGTTNGTEVGSEDYQKQNLDKARQLLKESGYNGERVVLLSNHEILRSGIFADVTAANLRKIGMNVDQQESDWGTLAQRRNNKGSIDKGGWNIYHVAMTGGNSPVNGIAVDQSCTGKNYPGWPCDNESERLRTVYDQAATPAARTAALEALHKRLWETLPFVLIGQYQQPFAWRTNITGVVQPSIVIPFWGLKKQ